MSEKIYPPVYLKTMAYAEKTGEMKFWRESRALDGECARQIDQIMENEVRYDNKSVETIFEEIDALLDQYGSYRVNFVLAETVDTLKNNSWINEINKLWSEMQGFPHYRSALDTADFILQKRVNPALLDDFLNLFRGHVYVRDERVPTVAESDEELHLDNPDEFFEKRKQYEKSLQKELVRIQKFGAETGFQKHNSVDFERSSYWFHIEIEDSVSALVHPYYFCCESLESLKKAIIWVVNETKFYEVTAFVKDSAYVTFRFQRDIDMNFDNYYHNFYRFTEDIRETYPEFLNRIFTDDQMREIYQSVVDKKEYPQFDGWLQDMCKSGLAYLCHKNYVPPNNKTRHAETQRNDDEGQNQISDPEPSRRGR